MRKEDKDEMKKSILLVEILFLFMASLFIIGCGTNDKANVVTSLDQRTNVVRDGHLNDYPNVKIGDAYDGFFSNPQWKYFEGEKKEKVVEFSGNCTYKDKEINVQQQFVLGENGTFTVGALAFNEIDQLPFIANALISKVYDTYYEKHPELKPAGPIQNAQSAITDKNLQGTVVATSWGNNSNGFLSLVKEADQYRFVLCDTKNQQVAEVPFSQQVYHFTDNKQQKNVPPLIFNLTILNDTHDRDEKDGIWNGENHRIPIYALYKFDANGKVIPGMLATAWGMNPSHYHGNLNEQKNMDLANLFLTEMIALQENCRLNQVDLP